MKTFTAQDMKDYADYTRTAAIMRVDPDLEHWCKERFEPAKKIIDMSVMTEHAKEDHSRCWKEKDIVSLIWEHAGIVHPKTKKKVIDLSVLIESGIDCEFSDDDRFDLAMKCSLVEALRNGNFECELGTLWNYCRPRMNHKHAWQGGACPLPEGFRVKVWWRDGSESTKSIASGNGLYWGNNNHGSDIIYFEVLEKLADGYVMPWEVS